MTTTQLRTPATNIGYTVGAWGILMALSVLAWWFGGKHGLPAVDVKAIDLVIFVLTLGKMFGVSHVFMEQRLAARWLRLSFVAWYAVVGGALLMFYVS
jgi:hypothetical protein